MRHLPSACELLASRHPKQYPSGRVAGPFLGGFLLDTLTARWAQWRERPFPEGWAGTEVNGVCLVELDTFAAGCITTGVHGNTIERKQISILRTCARDIEKVLPDLSGEAFSYFSELAGLVGAVLEKGTGRSR